MSCTVYSFAAQRKVQSLTHDDSRGQKFAPVPGQLIGLALNGAGIERKVAAQQLGISESVLSRVIRGEDGIDFRRLWLLGDDFWSQFVELTLGHKHLGRVYRTYELPARNVVAS